MLKFSILNPQFSFYYYLCRRFPKTKHFYVGDVTKSKYGKTHDT